MCDDKKHIDSEFPINKDWLEGQRDKRGLPPISVDPPKSTNTPVPEPKAPKTTALEVQQTTEVEKASSYNLNNQIKKADLEKRRQEIEKLKLQNAKLQGQLIPTDLVKSLIREFSEAMKISYLDAVESYTTIVAKQKKLTREQESKIKEHFTALINDTLKKQGVNAKKQLKNIVEDYQEVRGKGERK